MQSIAGLDKQTVLIVDDAPDSIDILREIFRDDYFVKAVNSGETAVDVIASGLRPDIILLDVSMPGIDGYETCRRLKADAATKDIPVIFVSAKIAIEDEIRGFEAGAADYIIKPFSSPIVRARVRNHLALYNRKRELAHKVVLRTEELLESQRQVLLCLGRAAEYKDYESERHSMRIILGARVLGLAADMTEEEAELLMYAASMHDLGKIGIPDAILQKAERLEGDELTLMRRHCEIGAYIIGDDPSELLQLARTVSLTHHEKWDGSGYPQGLTGDEIPLAGRIVAIIDAFDALTSNRPYKKAWSIEKAVAHIEVSSGKDFDPGLVQLFVQSLSEIVEIRKRYSET